MNVLNLKKAGWLAALLPFLLLGQAGADAAAPIKAFCIDFNWGEGGPNGFAKPGLWAEASPEDHVAWYTALGCNVIQTFAVSCNGYAWYQGGLAPPSPASSTISSPKPSSWVGARA